MKILIFSTAYFPHVGGAEVAVKEITNRISGVDFDMVTVRLGKKDAEQEKVGNINVYRIGFGLGRIDKLLFPFRAARLADKLHQKEKYNIVWSIMASFSGFAALFFKKKHPDVKFLLTLQEGDDLAQIEKKVWFVKSWFKQIFIKADYIQCISSYLAEWAKKMSAQGRSALGGGAKCDIEVVPNGVNQIADLRFRISDLRKELSIKEDEKVIVTTSRLVKKNGVEDLIKAFSILNIKYSIFNIKLVICGDGEERDKLEKIVKDLKIEDKVEFKGFIKPAELPKYYAIADVFCRPSLTEGLGNSFLEAMAVGLPVIATPVGGIPDFLENGKTGWFCKVKDPESIAEKIKYVLDEKNKDEVIRVIDNAKQMVLEKYNWDKIAPQMKNIFSALGGSALG
ncbi:MAG: glycosyltransferase family 4 protein [Patescibacteria group bacterium]|jgi:glycosyltransferase involved in cell wall biosynthesis